MLDPSLKDIKIKTSLHLVFPQPLTMHVVLSLKVVQGFGKQMGEAVEENLKH